MRQSTDHVEREISRSPIPLIAEILGYVGAALVLTAGGAVMDRVWSTWDSTAQMAAIGSAAAVLFLAGLPFFKHAEEALSRMAGVLWALSVGLLMWFLALLFADLVELDFGQTALAVGLIGGLVAGVLLALRRGALQQIPLYVGGIIATFGFAVAFGPTDHFCTGFHEPYWLTPSILTFAGLWFGAVAIRLLQPTATALVLGSVTLFAAPLFALGDLGDIAPLIGVVAAVILLATSVILRRVVLLVCGALGLFAYLNWTVARYFGESVGAPVALLVAGLGVLAIALVAAGHFGVGPDRPGTPASRSRPDVAS
jgi:hypothetical protein